MIDGRSTVAPGRVGTGAAQVFDTSAPVNQYLAAVDRAKALDLREQQRKTAEYRSRAKARKNQELDFGPNWSKFNDEIEKEINAIMDSDAKAYASGVDVNDPSWVGYRDRQNLIKRVKQKAADTMIMKQNYEKAMSSYDRNTHDNLHFEKLKSQWDEVETISDARNLSRNFNIEPYDFYEPLKTIKVGEVLKVYENLGNVTTTNKNRRDDPDFKNAVDVQVDNFLGSSEASRHLERGIEAGMWEDADGQEQWVRDFVLSNLPLEQKTTRDKVDSGDKKSTGWSFNLNSGSGSHPDFGLQYDYSLSPVEGVGQGLEVVDLRGKGTKELNNIDVIAVDGGEVVSIKPSKFERKAGGEIYLVGTAKVDDDRPGQTGKVDREIRVPVDLNQATIKNHFGDLDIEKFMDGSRTEFLGRENAAEEVVLEDEQETPQESKDSMDEINDFLSSGEGGYDTSRDPDKKNIIVIEKDGESVELDFNDPEIKRTYERVKEGKVDIKLLFYKGKKKTKKID